jgi:DNA-directed RNA polymerase specialized sigma24 family protein
VRLFSTALPREKPGVHGSLSHCVREDLNMSGRLPAARRPGAVAASRLRPMSECCPALEHAVYLLREVLQYSRANAAQMLNTSDADIDRRLERAMRCIGSAS